MFENMLVRVYSASVPYVFVLFSGGQLWLFVRNLRMCVPYFRPPGCTVGDTVVPSKCRTYVYSRVFAALGVRYQPDRRITIRVQYEYEYRFFTPWSDIWRCI